MELESLHAICMHAVPVCLENHAYGISPYSHFVREHLDDDTSRDSSREINGSLQSIIIGQNGLTSSTMVNSQ